MTGLEWMAIATAGSSLIDALLSNKKYPPEMERFLRELSVKGSELLNSPGLSAEEIEALFGKNFENVRGQGRNQRQVRTETLGRAGMLGTGAEIKAARQDAWANENLVTNAIRDMVIAKKSAKQQDLALATQMAQTAVGGEAARVEKGPDLTSLVTSLAMMGLFDGMGSGGGGKGLDALTQTGIDLAKAQVPVGGILGGYSPSPPLSWTSITGGTGIPWAKPSPYRLW